MNNNHDSTLLKGIHIYLVKLTQKDKKINRKRLFGELGMGIRIPKELRNKVISELIQTGILIRDNRDFFEVKRIKDSSN